MKKYFLGIVYNRILGIEVWVKVYYLVLLVRSREGREWSKWVVLSRGKWVYRIGVRWVERGIKNVKGLFWGRRRNVFFLF